MKLTLKMYIIIGVLIFIMIVSLFSGGSPILNLYTPGESVEVEKGEVIPEVKYNADLLSNITSGYRGIPKLVQNDNKVFFIPNEYAGGHLLRNFRIIGVNNSKAVEMKGDSDDIVDYKGAVILYGFQA